MLFPAIVILSKFLDAMGCRWSSLKCIPQRMPALNWDRAFLTKLFRLYKSLRQIIILTTIIFSANKFHLKLTPIVRNATADSCAGRRLQESVKLCVSGEWTSLILCPLIRTKHTNLLHLASLKAPLFEPKHKEKLWKARWLICLHTASGTLTVIPSVIS